MPENIDVDYVVEILKYGDRNRNLGIDETWNAIYFFGTNKLIEILKRTNLYGWDCIDYGENKDLFEILNSIYQEIRRNP